jgi:hypothetical protein
LSCGQFPAIFSICTAATGLTGILECALLEELHDRIVCKPLFDVQTRKIRLTRDQAKAIDGSFTLTPTVFYRDPYGSVLTKKGDKVVHIGPGGASYSTTVELPCWNVYQGNFKKNASVLNTFPLAKPPHPKSCRTRRD